MTEAAADQKLFGSVACFSSVALWQDKPFFYPAPAEAFGQRRRSCAEMDFELKNPAGMFALVVH